MSPQAKEKREKALLFKRFAVGYFFYGERPVRDVVEWYSDYISEIYFPWPGLLSARQLPGRDIAAMRSQLIRDLEYFRSCGIGLDLLFNATCYGESSCSDEQVNGIYGALRELEVRGILPEVVTTTSPFIAKIIRDKYPHIELRASVNMRLASTLAMEYLSDYFDSYYICRDIQRDLGTLKRFSEWSREHGKKLCMLANSGCLRNCPWQTFHETLLAHDFPRACRGCLKADVPPVLCVKMYRERRFGEFLRATWIRPEDLHLYAPYVETIKLSTRDAKSPWTILKAYTEQSYSGNVFDFIDPGFSQMSREYWLDNSAFPPDWAESGTAGLCAGNCTHCGKCEQVLEKVLKHTTPSFSVSGGTITVGGR